MDILGITIASILVLLVPGAWTIWKPSPQKDPIDQLAQTTGASIASIAICSLAFFLLKIRLNAYWAVLSLAIPLLLAIISHHRSRLPFKPKSHIILVLGFGLLLSLWRLYQARSLALPAWVDSSHHVLIIERILEEGGLPQDLSPYIPIAFNYHFAFHVSTALFSAISGLPTEQATLIFGQILNAAICFSVYSLARAIWQDWRRALIAALLVGFFSQMPAFYLSWGRYTLLTGLILLPLAMAKVFEIAASEGDKTFPILQLAIYTAGVFLGHYFAGLLLMLFILSMSIGCLVARTHSPRSPGITLQMILAGFGMGLLISAPWLYRAVHSTSGLFQVHQLFIESHLHSDGWASNPRYLWQLAGPGRGHLLLILGLFGSFLSIRSARARPLLIWSGLLALGCLPFPWRFSALRPDHFVIIIFLPATLFAAQFLIVLADRLKRKHGIGRFSGSLLMLPVGLLCVWGIAETRNIINPRTILASSEEVQALAWIKENTPQEALFFINATPWQEGLYRGVDGGIWILPLTGRSTILPPITYALGDEQLRETISRSAERASQVVGCSSDFWELVESEAITHIYLKTGVGSLQPYGLKNCEGEQNEGAWLDVVYRSEHIRIYHIMNANLH